MEDSSHLEDALHTLGLLLQQRQQPYDLVVVGGAALGLKGLVDRPTEDVDVVARVVNDRWISAEPLPSPLEEAASEVARALDLPRLATHGKNWLNSGPYILLRQGLPPGFASRVQVRVFGALTLRIASRLDLIFLKLWAATAPARGRVEVDIADLRALGPTTDEFDAAAAWCRHLDGRPDFAETDAAWVRARIFDDGSDDDRT